MRLPTCCGPMKKSAMFSLDERDEKLHLGMDVVEWCPFCGVELEGEISADHLSARERTIIQEFAFEGGKSLLRDLALAVFYRFLRRYGDSRRERTEARDPWPVEIQFMSETDNKCPDMALRARYRELVIGNWDALGRPRALFPGKFYQDGKDDAAPPQAEREALKRAAGSKKRTPRR